MKETLEAEVHNGHITLTLPEKPIYDPKIIEIQKRDKELVERMEKSPGSIDSYVKQDYNKCVNNKENEGGLYTWIKNTKFGKLIKYLHTEAPLPIRLLTYGTEAVTSGALFAGCTESVTPVIPVQESILLKDVEYQAGGNFNGIIYGCVPATTYMNVNYLGVNVTLEDVLNSGVVNNESQILKFAWDLGFEAKNPQLSIDEMMKSLKKDYLVIVRNKFGLLNDTPHSSLIIGIDKKEKIVTTHDPNTVFGAYYKRSFEEFEALSLSPQPGKFDVIVIYKGSEPWR